MYSELLICRCGINNNIIVSAKQDKDDTVVAVCFMIGDTSTAHISNKVVDFVYIAKHSKKVNSCLCQVN